MDNDSQKHSKIIQKVIQKQGWKTLQRKTPKWLPMRSVWAPFWHSRRALGLTWRALWPSLRNQILPLLPSVRFLSLRPQKEAKIAPTSIQNWPKMEPHSNKNHFENEPHLLTKTNRNSMACWFSAWGPAVTPALRAQ